MKTKIISIAVILALFTAMAADLIINGAEVFEQFGGEFLPRASHGYPDGAGTAGLKTVGSDNFSISAEGIKGVSFGSGFAKVTVRGASGKGGGISADIAYLSGNPGHMDAEAGNKAAEAPGVKYSVEGGQLSFHTDAGKQRDWTTVAVMLTLPNESSSVKDLYISNGSGDADIKDFPGTVHLNKTGGTLSLDSIGGLDGTVTQWSVINASDIKGSLELVTDRGNLTVDNASCGIKLVKSSGVIKCSNIAGDIKVNNMDGSIDIRSSRGNITAKAANAGITIAKVTGPVTVRSENGRIALSDIIGSINAVSYDGPVDIKLDAAAGYKIDAVTLKGSVAADLADAPGDGSEDARSFNGEVGDGTNKVSVSSAGGDITLVR